MESDLLSITVDADDYAEAAAGDIPSDPASRTYQSEADFAVHKASYSAKIDGQNSTYRDLISAVPVLAHDADDGGDDKRRLSKKDVQLLGYAVAEMYYDRDLMGVLDLCARVRRFCDLDGGDRRVQESLGRWERRCRKRLG